MLLSSPLITNVSKKKGYLNYYSAPPIGQKINIIKGMKNRIIKICNPGYLDSNFKKLVDIFVNNGYPPGLVRSIIYSGTVAPVLEQTNLRQIF